MDNTINDPITRTVFEDTDRTLVTINLNGASNHRIFWAEITLQTKDSFFNPDFKKGSVRLSTPSINTTNLEEINSIAEVMRQAQQVIIDFKASVEVA